VTDLGCSATDKEKENNSALSL